MNKKLTLVLSLFSIFTLVSCDKKETNKILARSNFKDYLVNKIDKKKDITDKNICFCFNYLLPDLFLDMVLINHFIRKIDKKVNDIYNPYINMVNYFYSLVLHSLENMLTEIKFNKIKKGLLESVVTDSIFIPQWFEIISIDYSKMNKKQREKEFMHIMDAIYNYGYYEDYLKMKIDMEKLCKEKNCSLDDLHYDNYPEEIEW